MALSLFLTVRGRRCFRSLCATKPLKPWNGLSRL